MPKDVVLAKTKKQYISDRDRKIFEMKFVQGMSYRTIAKEVGLSMAGTRKVFMRVVEQTRMEHMEDVMQLKAKGALVKQYIIAEAQKGYERSKQDKVKKVKKSGSTGKGDIDTEEETTEFQAGDPRFLDIMLKALSAYEKSYGADQPPEVVINGQMRVAGSNPDDVQSELFQQLEVRLKHLPGAEDFVRKMLMRQDEGVIDAN